MPTLNELYKEGVRLKEEKKYADAIVPLRAAAEMNGKFTPPLHAIVQCLTELGQHAEAVQTAQKIVQIEPEDPFAYIALSRAYQRAGMIPEAEFAMAKGNEFSMRARR